MNEFLQHCYLPRRNNKNTCLHKVYFRNADKILCTVYLLGLLLKLALAAFIFCYS